MNDRVELIVEPDHLNLETGRETILHLVATLRAHRGAAPARAALSVVFVLDVSHSMQGEPLTRVAEATRALTGMLGPEDRAAVVTFADEAKLVCPLASVNARTARSIGQRLDRLQTEGATHMHAGLELAQRVLPEACPSPLILLLSDGMPNRGPSSMGALGGLARAGRATVSTLGFGDSHDENTLCGIAEMGRGRYHYIRDPALCHLQLAAALGAQRDVAAEQPELVVRPGPGVQVLHTMGANRVRYGDGLIAELPNLIAGDERMLAMRLSAQGRSSTSGPLAQVVLRYTHDGERMEITRPLEVPVRTGAARLSRDPIRKVLILRAEEERKRARSLADQGRFSEAAQILRAAADMIASSPGFDGTDDSPLALAWDQLRDDADLFEQRPDARAYREFKRGQPLAIGGDFRADAQLPQEQGRAFVDAAAGPLPKAALVRMDSGERYALNKPINIIGRSMGCEIQVQSSKVSRRSAAVVAAAGRFWVEDLGSANGVWMNGEKVSKEALRDGDVIMIGDHQLRYEVRG